MTREARPSHHISSIAHLFLDGKDGESGPQSSSDIHLMVVGTGCDTSAPYTAVGLGHHFLDRSGFEDEGAGRGAMLPHRQVFFAETFSVCFSGVSHLQEGNFRPPSEGESIPWSLQPGVGESVFRLFPGRVPSEDFSGGLLGVRLFIRHLDLPRQKELNALETQASGGHRNGLGIDGTHGLIWCVQSSAAFSLSLVVRLGRLLRIVKPSIVHLLTP